jgi:hypothetical protein
MYVHTLKCGLKTKAGSPVLLGQSPQSRANFHASKPIDGDDIPEIHKYSLLIGTEGDETTLLYCPSRLSRLGMRNFITVHSSQDAFFSSLLPPAHSALERSRSKFWNNCKLIAHSTERHRSARNREGHPAVCTECEWFVYHLWMDPVSRGAVNHQNHVSSTKRGFDAHCTTAIYRSNVPSAWRNPRSCHRGHSSLRYPDNIGHFLRPQKRPPQE